MFTDSNDPSKIFNFDLEAGKIVEEFTSSADQKVNELNHITNKIKNGQSTSENTFVAVSDKAIFTIDPRINKKQKNAEEKIYKTNPNFN